METMASLRDLAEAGTGVGEMLEEVLARTGYIEALEAERTIEAQGRIENLQELVEVGKEYDATAEEAVASTASSSRSPCSRTRTPFATRRACSP